MATPSIVPRPRPRAGGVDPLARRLALALLARLRDGEVVLEERGRRHRFGSSGPAGLAVTVRIHSDHAYAAACRGSAGLVRGYVDGLWDCDDIAALIRIVCRNLGTLDRLRDLVQPLAAPAQLASGWVRRNTRRRSRRRIGAHYDIGDDLFAAMLDETMAYSCGVFRSPDASLREASEAKMELACAKLRLQESDHLLEIGGGWGGLAVHAARHHGCRVTMTTISRNQFDHARRRVAEAGLAGRVAVLLEDYRDLHGSYDKLVSIEMIEAVGWHHLATYFSHCTRLLRPDGAMLLQAIITSDALYRRWRGGTGVANNIVFPGGSIPSLEAILAGVAAAGDLRMVHLEDITPHYARTLRHWRERFLDSRELLDGRRYDERFCRLWEFYLAYCEGGFAERRIRDVQLLLARPAYRDEAAMQTGDAEAAPDLRVVQSA